MKASPPWLIGGDVVSQTTTSCKERKFSKEMNHHTKEMLKILFLQRNDENLVFQTVEEKAHDDLAERNSDTSSLSSEDRKKDQLLSKLDALQAEKDRMDDLLSELKIMRDSRFQQLNNGEYNNFVLRHLWWRHQKGGGFVDTVKPV